MSISSINNRLPELWASIRQNPSILWKGRQVVILQALGALAALSVIYLVVKHILHFNTLKDSSERKARSADEHNQNLQAQIATHQQTIEALGQQTIQIGDLSQQLSDATNKIEKLSQQLKEKEQTLATLQETYQPLHQESDLNVSNWEKERAELTTQLHNLQSTYNELFATYEAMSTRLEKTESDLKTSLERSRDENAPSHESQELTALKAAVKKLDQENQDLSKELQASQDLLEAARAALDEKENDAAELNTTTESLLDENRPLAQHVSALHTALFEYPEISRRGLTLLQTEIFSNPPVSLEEAQERLKYGSEVVGQLQQNLDAIDMLEQDVKQDRLKRVSPEINNDHNVTLPAHSAETTEFQQQ